MPVNVWSVTAAAAVAALAAGLGALPSVFVRDMSRRWLGVSNALAAAVMIVAAGGLVWQGAGIGPWRVASGLVGGGAFVWVFRVLIGNRDDLEIGGLAGTDAMKASSSLP